MYMAFKKHLVWIKWLLFIIVILVLSYVLRKNILELKEYDFHIKGLYLVTSFFILISATLLLPLTWHYITLKLDCNLSLTKSLRIRLQTEMGKYLPGRILGYGYLIIFYKNAGKDILKVTSASFYELYLSTFSSVLFFSLIQFITPFDLFTGSRTFFLIICLVGIVFLHPLFFKIIADLLSVLLKRNKLNKLLPFYTAIKFLLIYQLYWFFYGIASWLFVSSFVKIQVSEFLFIAGSFALSTFAGLIAFFLPAGLGAREGVLIYLLGLLFGQLPSMIISISSRIWLILCDLFLFIYASIFGFHSYLGRKNKSLG